MNLMNLQTMSSTLSFIEDFWEANEQNGQYPTLLIQKISDDPNTNIYIGYNELGNRCLFLNVNSISNHKIQIKSANINLKSNDSSNLLYIELVDKYFGELFNDLIFSIFNKLFSLPEDLRADQFIILYKKWHELFKKNDNQSGLNDQQLMGLIGELTFLKHLISKVVTPTDVNNIVSAWGGPEGRATDFTFPAIAYEIKTISHSKEFIDISSEFQLSCETIPVHLVVYKAEISEKGFSLFDLVTSIRNDIDIKLGETEAFLYKINSFKLDFINVSNYKNLKIILPSPITYDASSIKFPKIVSKELTQGIFGVKYKINLNSITNFKI